MFGSVENENLLGLPFDRPGWDSEKPDRFQSDGLRVAGGPLSVVRCLLSVAGRALNAKRSVVIHGLSERFGDLVIW